MTHLLPFFFPPLVHASTRTCLISEGEGVGTTDRRVWHKRTFPGATDVRPTHSPPHPTQVDKWPRPLCGALVLGTSLRKMMNKHMCTKCKNIFIKNILNIMALLTKNLKYTVGMDIVTNYKQNKSLTTGGRQRVYRPTLGTIGKTRKRANNSQLRLTSRKSIKNSNNSQLRDSQEVD